MKAVINFFLSVLRLLDVRRWPYWRASGYARAFYAIIIAFFALWFFQCCVYPAFFRWYTGDKTGKAVFESSKAVSANEFETIAARIEADAMKDYVAKYVSTEKNETYRKEKERLLKNTPSVSEKSGFAHIKYFRDAGITRYEGPKTCLKCHETMKVRDEKGNLKTVDLMEDVTNNVHFNLFEKHREFSTVGYDGKMVNKEGFAIPVGKIDRACGIPASFSWTGWAALIEAKPKRGEKHLLSEGCGQCHFGGMYGPPSDHMMPLTIKDKNREDAIDCLICHSRTYDMNEKYVVKDDVGLRWNQDRSMKAAMSVGKPTSGACLNCHQHNMGGDTYENNEAAKADGYKNKRILHNWSKRGNPYSPQHDVHAKAGVQCLDCHLAVGHKIARGKMGSDLVSNDLPGVEVSCEKCHGSAPHFRNELTRGFLNGHSESVACQTCHITQLQKNTIILIDWANPKFNEEEGIYLPEIVYATGDVRKGVGYLWWNGLGTFLANAIGDNPGNPGHYNPLMDVITKFDLVPGIKAEGGGVVNNDFLSQMDAATIEKRREMVKNNIAPYQSVGKSKIYPFRMFNAQMLEDMNNKGPFGAMILPFDYNVYFETGKPLDAVKKAIMHPIVKRMYQSMFKYYMMDRFMYYFGVMDGWKTQHPLDADYPGKIEPHWMRQMGNIAINHGISEKGFACSVCHTPGGLLNFKKLGYSSERAAKLENLPEMEFFKNKQTGVTFDDLYDADGQPKDKF